MEEADDEVKTWDEISESVGLFLLIDNEKRIGRLVRVQEGGVLHIHFHRECFTLGKHFSKVNKNVLVQTDDCDDVLFGNTKIYWPAGQFQTLVQLREAGENRLETAWPQQGTSCPCCLNRPDAPPPPSVQGKHLIHKGTRFQVGSFVLVDSNLFPQIYPTKPQPVKRKRKSTKDFPEQWRSLGTTEVKAKRPLAVAKILKITETPLRLRLQWFCRPEDIEPKLKSTDQKVIIITNQEIELKVQVDTQLEKCFALPTKDPKSWATLTWVNEGPLRYIFDLTRSHQVSQRNIRQAAADCKKSSKEAVDWTDMAGSEKLTLLDIFSGAGGLSKGLEMSGGVEVKAAIEIDREAAKAFENNFPNCTVLKNDAFKILRNLDKGTLSDEVVQTLRGIDMVCAGSPCQGFSKLNRCPATENANDQRSMYLIPIQFFKKLKAKYMLIENVESAISSAQGKACVSMLVSQGYQIAIKTLRCVEFGLPQTRTRSFLIAAVPEVKLPKFPASTHSSKEMSGAYRPTTVLEAIGDLNPKGNSYSADQPLSAFQSQMRQTGQYEIEDHDVVQPTNVNAARFSVIPEGGNWSCVPNKKLKMSNDDETTPLKYAYSKKDDIYVVKDEGKGKNLEATIPYRIACTAGKSNQWGECFRRSKRHGQVKTISASSTSPSAKQIGNAVPSLVAWMIGLEFAKVNNQN